MCTREGTLDERVLLSFETSLATLSRSVVLIGLCSKIGELDAKVSRLFLYVYQLEAPTLTERVSICENLIAERGLALETESLVDFVAG